MRSHITAVLGPTNTGKTHLAVERLCAHSSGIIGFPLRLLAREVYDRVVAIKGAASVGLITGEERILPPDARWLLSTAESMPLDRDVAFVAVDEIQLATEPERGHVFTDRIMRARGREETMLLGSEPMRPIVRALVPEAEIITRPRFSKLSFEGSKKLSRLPPRSVIVAFSAAEVYALAEALRRTKGGAAVVMGALSPRTRNAQVAMFQSGEVDYLVATDAIGMGLNLDVGHLAFAGLSKFDGKKNRRLSLSEMAQIAGRAGRHQRDGSFGVLAEGQCAFTDVEIERIEDHRFQNINNIFWRNSDLNYEDIDALIASLTCLPDSPILRAAPEAVDLAVLRAVSVTDKVISLANTSEAVRRLWDACGLPDFRKLGPEHHAQLVLAIFEQIGAGRGHIATEWIARELTRLDSLQGDLDTLSARMAAVRTWAYVAHRRDWLADPAHWAARAREIEDKLSDTLHQRLIERFVDRRTSVLIRALADHGPLKVEVDAAGAVCVEDQPIGTLEGFQFKVDPQARLGERKRLLSAAEHHLPKLLAKNAHELAGAADQQFRIEDQMGKPICLFWRGHEVARLKKGTSLLNPRIEPDFGVPDLPLASRDHISARLQAWMRTQVEGRLFALLKLSKCAVDPAASPAMRALLYAVLGNGGFCERQTVEGAVAELSPKDRHQLKTLGLVIGTLDVFHPAALKPGAVHIVQALKSARVGGMMPPRPMPGLGLLDKPSAALAQAAQSAGFRRFGSQMLRIDLVERIARAAHDARGKERDFTPDRGLATSLGIGESTFALILRNLGFVPVNAAGTGEWRWKGRHRRKPASVALNPAFKALQALK